MTTYTVHAPAGKSLADCQPEDLMFVPDKFRYWAFAFGPFWLIANRLWLALAGWVVVALAIGVIAKFFAFQPQAVSVLYLLLAFLLGLEGSALQRFGLTRRRYKLIDITNGVSLGQAELSHFSRWAKARPEPGQQPPYPRPPGQIAPTYQSAGLSPVETGL